MNNELKSFVCTVLVVGIGLSEIGHNPSHKYIRLDPHNPVSEAPVNWGGRAILASSTTSGGTITILGTAITR